LLIVVVGCLLIKGIDSADSETSHSPVPGTVWTLTNSFRFRVA
jgi:hypothetical protein